MPNSARVHAQPRPGSESNWILASRELIDLAFWAFRILGACDIHVELLRQVSLGCFKEGILDVLVQKNAQACMTQSLIEHDWCPAVFKSRCYSVAGVWRLPIAIDFQALNRKPQTLNP